MCPASPGHSINAFALLAFIKRIIFMATVWQLMNLAHSSCVCHIILGACLSATACPWFSAVFLYQLCSPGSFLPIGCVLGSNRRQNAAQGVYHLPVPVEKISQLGRVQESTIKHVVPRPDPSIFTAKQGGTSRGAGDDLSWPRSFNILYLL